MDQKFYIYMMESIQKNFSGYDKSMYLLLKKWLRPKTVAIIDY